MAKKSEKAKNSKSLSPSMHATHEKNDNVQKTVPEVSGQAPQKTIDWPDVWSTIIESLKPESASSATNKKRDTLLSTQLEAVIAKSGLEKKYNILILHDEGTMLRSDIDKIYSAITAFKEKKQILLILYSMGGDIGSGYLIGKLCKEYSSGEFSIAIPRRAKSAATLLCCAAGELHLGSLSELGPIDPQIDRMPALGLKSSIEHIATLVQQYPGTAEMFAKYLSYSLKPIDLGYYERVAESAKQYAERLLKEHATILPSAPEKIAKTLVYDYKDHSFVIDKTEVQSIFGNKVVQFNTPEYNLANEIYGGLSTIGKLAGMMNYTFYFIGSASAEPNFFKQNR